MHLLHAQFIKFHTSTCRHHLFTVHQRISTKSQPSDTFRVSSHRRTRRAQTIRRIRSWWEGEPEIWTSLRRIDKSFLST
jgi:hypothetical protein